MAVKFKNGTSVEQVMPAPVQGTVTRFIFDEKSGDVIYVVTDKNDHEWTFTEDQIQEAK